MPNFLGSVVKTEKPKTVLDAVEAGVGLLLVIGHLGRDPEFRTTSGGKELAKFNVAVSWGKRGEPDQKTEWIVCQAWEERAEVMRDFSKGDAILVLGKPGSREYQGNQYGDLTVWEIARPIWRKMGQSNGKPVPQAQSKQPETQDTDIPF